MLLKVLFVSLLVLSALADDPYQAILVQLQSNAQSSALGNIQVCLTNKGGSQLSVLKWDIPGFDPAGGRALVLTQPSQSFNGLPKQVRYNGARVKRGDPVASSYQVLNPGQSVCKDLMLGNFFDLVSTPGRFDIQFIARIRDILIGQEPLHTRDNFVPSSSPLQSNVVTITTTAPLQPSRPIANSLTFNQCTKDQKKQVKKASKLAQAYSGKALQTIKNGANAKEYTQWFGPGGGVRQAQVQSVYQNLKNYAAKTYDCSTNICPTDDTYAYVFPDDSETIYLCQLFWNALLTGTDSKAGTLIQVASHFTSLGATNDHVYGQSAAKQLAASDPDGAADNADSYEYFAELISAPPPAPVVPAVNATTTAVPATTSNSTAATTNTQGDDDDGDDSDEADEDIEETRSKKQNKAKKATKKVAKKASKSGPKGH